MAVRASPMRVAIGSVLFGGYEAAIYVGGSVWDLI